MPNLKNNNNKKWRKKMRYESKSELPRFQEFMLNEIYKIKGDATKLTLEERLDTAYQIIKNNESIYKKFKNNNFLKSFIFTAKTLYFKTDTNPLVDIIHLSYEVLKDKEEVEEYYKLIQIELENNNYSIQPQKTTTHRKKI